MTREALLAELRPHIADDRVLAAVAAVPREAFVAPGDRARAWDNRALAIGCGQTISQPLVVARMCEMLRIAPGDRVLDVGTGSGYHAAVLAALGARVVSIELHRALSAAAAPLLPGVELVVGDGRAGHPAGAPYDAISVAATAGAEIPRALVDQLAAGGRLIAPLRCADTERLVLLTRGADGAVERAELEEVRFVPLV
ncbi:MAG: protein-L-isoaspartate(D-aspartate) O-methyltransferase [Solirubrobacteraceae bacterium]|jgi:protein-L-isoaspartate(D-aspartate) O-methyltransferase|nr:protein-L-isoaspartate(D-aspartate) O-methyltransferase [Solirubrobacteraceae bacterium]